MASQLDWIEPCFTSPPTQYIGRLYGRRFSQVKRPNQQHQSTEEKRGLPSTALGIVTEFFKDLSTVCVLCVIQYVEPDTVSRGYLLSQVQSNRFWKRAR